MSVRLSVVLIVKNEALNLAACLDSVKDLADEIVVLDAGSDDETVNVAESYQANVYVNADWPGFGKQRQIAQQYASGDWIFMLDADERVTPELSGEIREIVNKITPDKGFYMPRLSWVFGRYIRHGGWYPDYVLRLYPRHLGQYNDSLVHEKVVLDKSVQTEKLKGDMLHYTYDDLNHYLTKSANYAKAWSQQRQARGKKTSLWTAWMHGLACFMKMYVFRLGFLDGKQGWLLAYLSSYSTFAKYADLWVAQQQKNN